MIPPMKSIPLQTGCLALALFLCTSAKSAPEEPATEDTTAKFQATYAWQRHPDFQEKYSGPNSLTSARESMYTASITAHLGARVWSGGEVYFNPEVTQGVPFTNNLVGLGTFTNGEITRSAGTNPTFYRQRLFLRQTWNQGGDREVVDSDFNQMRGVVDSNRFVLTAGNFSTLDVFDDNAYAKDPRTQFMNWGNWTYGAYDYAADARGFGWGVAGEWYRDNWVVRFARMTGPKTPNGLPIDYAIGRHYGDQIELEHRHELNGKPGKLRVIGWRNRANVASFSDALDYLKNNPGTDPQSFFKVRNGEKIKYGVGINLEQEIHPNVGYFMRAMHADGRTETYAFGEVDDSFSNGVLVKGQAWGREKDTAGFAFLMNGLSKQRRQFLEAGGVSFFIGDGGLNYKPETVVETFYSLHLLKETWLTANYQRIQNPAYNSDRGPVNVYGLRFHTEF